MPQNDGGKMDAILTPNDFTLRDWFAGQALSGLLANPEIEIDQDRLDIKEKAAALCATWCYSLADAMLTERKKFNTNEG